MSILPEVRFGVLFVSVAALAGCGSLAKSIAPFPPEQAGMVREACGFIPSGSQLKSSAGMRRQSYLACKRKVLEKESENEPVSGSR